MQRLTLTYLVIFIFKADFIFPGYQKAGDRDQDLTPPMWHHYFGKNVVLTHKMPASDLDL